MRHRVAGYKLDRDKDERRALRKILINQLFTHERIRTTRTKAAAIRGQAERLITLAKNGNAARESDPAYNVHARRLAAARMMAPATVKKLFDEIAPRYQDRPGGYTRVLRLTPRRGDSAEMVLLELVE